MGYKNFSEICPIFNTDNDSGVEKEMTIPWTMGSCTVSTWGMFNHRFGREVVVQEIFGHTYQSTTCCVELSCSQTIGLYKSSTHDVSSAVIFGSLGFGSVEMSMTGDCIQSASMTSTSFTSTDILMFCNLSFAQLGRLVTNERQPYIVIRYREK